MKSFSKYRTILWDFDGVLMDSMPVRDRGFEIVLANYPAADLERLLHYHRQNGGLSRYVKFRYFFEVIRNEPVTDGQVLELAARFSDVMRRELVNEQLLIQNSIEFVKREHTNFNMHVVSGSDQEELRYLCATLKLDGYFRSIHGSPKSKKDWVAELIQLHNYERNQTLLIGDSRNDWEAADHSGIDFMGYNNKALQGMGNGYIEHF
jgi:phosphoglycolate phosphatase-like HAD superfamily hydrolase